MQKNTQGQTAQTESTYLVLEPEIKNLWTCVYDQFREEFGEAVFRSWLKPMTLQAYYHGTMEVSVPTRFMRDWIQQNYSKKILSLCAVQNTDIKRFEIVVLAQPIGQENVTSTAPAKANSNTRAIDEKVSSAIEDLSSPLDGRFTFDTFITGPSNELAYAAARRVVETDLVPFNPLFIHGGVGLGKTHLMQAIAWELSARNPETHVMYLSAEKFMYQFVRAIRAKDTMEFKEIFRSVDVLMIDDIQFMAGKESTQEEFFHTFNALIDQNKQIIISGDRAPSELSGLDERLRSRLGWGLVTDVAPSDFTLRLNILKSKAMLMDYTIDEEVMGFVAEKVTSSIREMEGALNRIAAHVDLTGKVATIETAKHLLQDLLRSHDRRITIDEIQRKVTDFFNLKLSDMQSCRRARTVARPRQIAMYMCKQLTPRSLPEIGRKFGGRDHTTVMHAVRKIDELIASDIQIAQDVDAIRRSITG